MAATMRYFRAYRDMLCRSTAVDVVFREQKVAEPVDFDASHPYLTALRKSQDADDSDPYLIALKTAQDGARSRRKYKRFFSQGSSTEMPFERRQLEHIKTGEHSSVKLQQIEHLHAPNNSDDQAIPRKPYRRRSSRGSKRQKRGQTGLTSSSTKLEQIASMDNFSSQQQDEGTCHQALQDLEAAPATAHEIEVLPVVPQEAQVAMHRHLQQNAPHQAHQDEPSRLTAVNTAVREQDAAKPTHAGKDDPYMTAVKTSQDVDEGNSRLTAQKNPQDDSRYRQTHKRSFSQSSSSEMPLKQRQPGHISTEMSSSPKLQQLVSRVNTSLQQQDASTCHQALQDLQVALATATDSEVLAVVPLEVQAAVRRHMRHFAPHKKAVQRNAPHTKGITQEHLRNQQGSTKPPLKPKAHRSQQESEAIVKNRIKSLDNLGKFNLIVKDSRTELLQLLLSHHHQDWAQDFLLMLPRTLPATTCKAFVLACAEHKSYEALKQVMKAIPATGCWLTNTMTFKIMAICRAAHDLQAMQTWFEWAVASESASCDMYAEVMTAYFEAGRPQEAYVMWDRLKASGLELTLHSYHVAMSGSQPQHLQELYAELMSQQHLPVKDITFGIVLKTAANSGGKLPAAWTLQVLSDMRSCNVQLNSHIFAAFLQAITPVSLDANQLEAVFRVMASYRAHQSPSSFVYSSLLTFCAKQAPDRALDVWHALQEDKLLVTSYLFSSMFAACAAAGSPEMLEAADRSHMHLEGLWNKICSKGQTAEEERSMLTAHNALLHVYATYGQVQKAKQLFVSMQERGPAIDSISASTLIAAFAKSADKDAALEVYDDMRAKGLQPTSQCYTSLLAACARAGDLHAARRVFNQMHVPPNVEAYTALMDACLKQKQASASDEAFQVFAEMKAKGLKPTGPTYGCLMMVCARQNAVDLAFQIYREAYTAGVLEGDECHNILVGICSKAGRVDDALDLVKSLASKHGVMHQKTINTLICALLKVRQVPRALRMLSIMRNMGLRPYKSTMNTLIGACARNSNTDEAAEFYWELRKLGGEASKASSSELIISLCKAGDRLQALRVYHDMTFAPAPALPATARPPLAFTVKKGKSGQGSARQQWQAGATADLAAAIAAASVSGGSFDGERASADTIPDSSFHGAMSAASDYIGYSAAEPSLKQSPLHQQPTAAAHLAPAGTHQNAALQTGCASNAEASIRVTSHGLLRKPVQLPDSSVPSTAEQPDTMAATSNEQSDSNSNLNSDADFPEARHSQSTVARQRNNFDQQIGPGSRQKSHNADASIQVTSHGLLRKPVGLPEHPNLNQNLNSTPGAEFAEARHDQSMDVRQSSNSHQLISPGSRSRSLAGGAMQATAVATPTAGSGGQQSSLRLSQKGTPVFPTTAAMAALVHAFANVDDLDECHRLYKQLQQDKKGLPGLTHSHKKMWEAVIEAACRADNTEWALEVFDDWKANSISSMFVWKRPKGQLPPTKFPHLSNATLAFLESRCRSSPDHEWRVFDVCAVMRQQSERKQEAALPRPAKKSHHVAE